MGRSEGGPNWSMWRLMMQLLYDVCFQIAKFQFNVKLSRDKEKQTCCRESNLNHVCVSGAWPSSLNFTQVLFSITM